MSEVAASTTSGALPFNPWDENFRRNPYSYYRPLLAAPPPILRFFMPVAIVCRYHDVRAALTDQHRFSSVPIRNRMTIQTTEIFGDAPTLIGSDPPIHSRLRKVISRDFTPRAIRDLVPRIREITHRLLDQIEQRGCFDLMSEFAIPLPLMIIAEMLGIPGERFATFKRWSDALIELSCVQPGAATPDSTPIQLTEMRDYFAAEIEKRHRNPGRDLMSSLVAAHDDSETLDAGELMHFLVILLIAGNETTTNLIGNGMLALASNHPQIDLLRSRPELLPSAIEEMLRYDSPVQALFRTAKEDLEIGGIPLEKGTGVVLMLGAANRDPAQFKNPDTFDITREDNQHVSFGEGIHHCLGAGLARLEASIAFGALIERFPRLRLADNANLEYKNSFFVRGLTSLPMMTE
jgi:cytochrome P450